MILGFGAGRHACILPWAPCALDAALDAAAARARLARPCRRTMAVKRERAWSMRLHVPCTGRSCGAMPAFDQRLHRVWGPGQRVGDVTWPALGAARQR